MPQRISNLPATPGIIIGLVGGVTQNITVVLVAWVMFGLAWYFARLEQPQPRGEGNHE